MPIYSFRDEDDNLIEHMISHREYAEMWNPDGVYVIEDKTLTRDIAADMGPQRHGDIWAGGLTSECVAVDPSQIAEAEAYSREIGVPTHYRKDGCPIFTSETHRSKFIKKHGYQDAKRYDA